MRKVVFLSGPISSDNVEQIAQHLHAFAEAENRLTRAGFAVINPAADWPACGFGGVTYEDFMEKDEALIWRSDIFCQLEGWEDSKGSMRELGWAVRASLRIVSVEECERMEAKTLEGTELPY